MINEAKAQEGAEAGAKAPAEKQKPIDLRTRLRLIGRGLDAGQLQYVSITCPFLPSSSVSNAAKVVEAIVRQGIPIDDALAREVCLISSLQYCAEPLLSTSIQYAMQAKYLPVSSASCQRHSVLSGRS